MTSLVKYDKNHIPSIHGLAAGGNRCYMNSLIQCLLSLPSLNFKIRNTVPAPNPLWAAYQELLMGKINSTHKFVSILVKSRSGSDNFRIGSQEDFHEGLNFVIEVLGNGVENLFAIRHHEERVCKKCDKKTDGPTAKPEMTVEIFDTKQLPTKKDIEGYIKFRVLVPEDYKCENCHAHNTKGAPNIIQMYKLRRISSVIVMVFNKYDKKECKFFPETLDFQSINGVLQYKLVGQAEHYGTRFGGHYNARVLRDEVYLADDSHVKPSSFSPTPNTYVVLYHLT